MTLRAAVQHAACLLALAVVPGCYGNEQMTFNDMDGGVGFGDGGALTGLEPWEAEIVAMRPAATEDDPCPEMLNVAANGRYMRALSSHAVGCVHQPLATVWQAIIDPQVGRDPTSTTTFDVVEPRIDAECPDGDFDALYQTQWHAMSGAFGADARLCWRHGVVEGSVEEPLRAASRWQKVWGTTAITTLEGSMLAYPLAGHPDITVVEYQYHLDSLLSDHGTIDSYLRVIYGRLVERSHGRPL